MLSQVFILLLCCSFPLWGATPREMWATVPFEMTVKTALHFASPGYVAKLLPRRSFEDARTALHRSRQVEERFLPGMHVGDVQVWHRVASDKAPWIRLEVLKVEEITLTVGEDLLDEDTFSRFQLILSTAIPSQREKWELFFLDTSHIPGAKDRRQGELEFVQDQRFAVPNAAQLLGLRFASNEQWQNQSVSLRRTDRTWALERWDWGTQQRTDLGEQWRQTSRTQQRARWSRL